MSSKPLLLITGATGHLIFATLLNALKNGYHARISIRRAEQETKLRANSYLKPYANDIEFVVVPDITAPGAFDNAVKDVEYIIHGASPIPSKTLGGQGTYQTIFIDPAVAGAVGILESAAKESNVKRVILTSSIVAADMIPGKAVSPESIASPPSEDELKNIQDPVTAYRLSKRASHNAAKSFMEHTRPDFTLVYILPSYTQGANVLHTHSYEVGYGSNDILMDAVLGVRKNPDAEQTASLVHVEDVARAHVLALDQTKAKDGESFLLIGNGGKNINWADLPAIVKKYFPDEIESGFLPPTQTLKARFAIGDISKTVGTPGLGMGELLGFEEMVKSTVGQYIQLKKAELAA